jgi:hypothetical protein
MSSLPKETTRPSVQDLSVQKNPLQQLSLKSEFENGMHFLSGTVYAATTCETYHPSVSIDGDSRKARIGFNSITVNRECKMAQTPFSFMLAFAAEKDITFDATFNGVPVELLLNEVNK